MKVRTWRIRFEGGHVVELEEEAPIFALWRAQQLTALLDRAPEWFEGIAWQHVTRSRGLLAPGKVLGIDDLSTDTHETPA